MKIINSLSSGITITRDQYKMTDNHELKAEDIILSNQKMNKLLSQDPLDGEEAIGDDKQNTYLLNKKMFFQLKSTKPSKIIKELAKNRSLS